jgi:hypothetical protein
MATITGSVSTNPTKYSYRIEWSESNINIAANTSDVTANVYVQKISNYSSESSSNAHDLKIDNVKYSDNNVIDMNPETTARLCVGATRTITHNADGSKQITLKSGLAAGNGVLPSGAGFGPTSGTASATITLSVIPREAYVSNAVSFTLGTGIPLTIVNPGNFYVKAKLYVNGVLIKTENLGQVTSATLTPDSGEIAAAYAQIPNATSCAMYVRLETYSDSGYTTQIGSYRDQTGTMSINQTTNKPTFTTFTASNLDKNIVVIDKYGNTLITSSTTTLIGSDAAIIKGYSKARAVITAANKMVALNSATAIKYVMTMGTLNAEGAYSSGSTVNIDIDNALTNAVSISAIDSRNLFTTVNVNIATLVQPTPVSIWGLVLARDNAVEDGTKLQFSGAFWKQYFGGGSSGVLNAVVCQWRYKLTTDAWAAQTWNTITPTDDGSGNLSYDSYINGDLGAAGFDPEKSFDIEVRIYDKVSHMIIEETLSKGIPLIDYTQDGVGIKQTFDPGVDAVLQLAGKISMDGVAVDSTPDELNLLSGMTAAKLSGRLKGITMITTGSGTYNVPAGVEKILVEIVGGGAGGGGATRAASNCGCAGGGGAGGYSRYFIDAPSSSYSYAVGAKGTGGANSGANGNAGGNTTFGGMTANGGAAGIGMTSGNTLISTGAALGGTASGGDINISGGVGEAGLRLSGTYGKSGIGGSNPLGIGSRGFGGSATGTPIAATGYGAGGGGAYAIGSAQAGGDGTDGVIIIYEYYGE